MTNEKRKTLKELGGKTLKELGAIILAAHNPEDVALSYGIDVDEVAEIGRAALLYGDISPNGELN